MLAQSTALPLGLGGQAADLGTGGGGVEIVDVEETMRGQMKSPAGKPMTLRLSWS
jgi:hypothetical protein